MKKASLFVIILLALSACHVKPGAYSPTSVPSLPDYSKNESWAALPSQKDPADRTPATSLENRQETAQVDVFFIHPTTFTSKKDKGWNASIGDAKLNQKTDETTILYQASIFNGAGKVYAPRYRQAHLRAFYSEDKKSGEAALALAYADVKAAFQYFLDHHNQSRPIIIASHSQGTMHGVQLLKDFFDGKPLQNRLVCAYLVGWPVRKQEYKKIPPCENPEQTGCFCSWRSFEHGYIPKNYVLGDSILVTNPLTWKTDDLPADKSLNEGSVLRNFEKIFPQIADAQVHNGILWIRKPKFPGSFFLKMKNYHIADFNFFYLNVRKNAQHRVDLFWK